jgi:hypothetical protein
MDETEEFYFREYIRENMWLDQNFSASHKRIVFREYIIKWCDESNKCMKQKEILCYEDRL